MKKFDLSKIMKDAWKMFKENAGSFADCLRKAWAIAKGIAKKQFTGSANVYGFEFALWEKYGKRRIYINNYSGRNKSNRGGYIDLDNDNYISAVGSAKFAAHAFLKAYEV